MSLIKLIDLPSLGDQRGGLVAIESNQSIPFEIKRLYYIFNTTNQSRGFHAHIDLKQVAVCVKGSCRFILDSGHVREEVILSSPTQGLYIDALTWREMHDFSDDCVLLVLASEHYDENDYIRDYQDFLNFSKLQLVEYDRVFLDMSWMWLNDKQLKYLTMTPEFSREEQQAFFKNLPKRKDYFIKGVTYKEIPIGACGLKNISGDQAELWLYIGDKEYWGKGLGEKIMLLLEREAVNLNVRKIYLKVLEENKAAIGLYKKLSYIDAKFNGNHILMEKIL